jgi:hypothetical protein
MYPCLTQVRSEVEKMVVQLFEDIPDLQIGIITHGDYCDGPKLSTNLPFTSDKAKIVSFVRTAPSTGGGDAPEAYEYVLYLARNTFKWIEGSKRALVLIGDDVPHGPSYYGNTQKIDWRKEIEALQSIDVNVYAVQALNRRHATPFYMEVAHKTGGFHLSLDQFHTTRDLIMAICYKQVSDDALLTFEQQIEKAGRMNRGLDYNFGVLSGRITSDAPTEYDPDWDKKEFSYSSTPRYSRPSKPIVTARFTTDVPLAAVEPSRFQVMKVNHNCSIKDFVEENGLIFKTGRGFYEFTKAETIQHHKEIVLLHEASGDMFTGEKAREMLGLPIGTTARTRFKPLDGYTVFVQSTSYNRKLIGETRFLYEVDMSR